jgi:hypothetical protein
MSASTSLLRPWGLVPALGIAAVLASSCSEPAEDTAPPSAAAGEPVKAAPVALLLNRKHNAQTSRVLPGPAAAAATDDPAPPGSPVDAKLLDRSVQPVALSPEAPAAPGTPVDVNRAAPVQRTP